MKSAAKQKLTHQDYWNAAGVQGSLEVVKRCVEEVSLTLLAQRTIN